MFERFTDRARRSVVLSQEAARSLNHNYIGTEHILLGVMEVGDGPAWDILQTMGVDIQKTREYVIEQVGMGETSPTGHIPFTPRAKKILEMSLREAISLGHNFIDMEHILLALAAEEEGVAYTVLRKMGADPKELRAALLAHMTGSADGPPTSGAQDDPERQSGIGGVMSRAAGRFGGGKSNSALDQFGVNLTAQAAEGKLDPVIGREVQLERILQVLSRRTKNNPVLTGEPGVGKSSIVEGLAQAVVAGNVPSNLLEMQLYSLDMGAMIAGSRYRGDFEERMKKVMQQVKADPNIVLFIDEIHTLVGAGASEGAMDASSMLKPMLARGEIKVIGATTFDEYRKHIEKDAALERRFAPVQVPAPTVEETVNILFGLRDRYEAHHKVMYTDDALRLAANLADRYINDRFLPDKAIDVIDEAGSRVRMSGISGESDELVALKKDIAIVEAEKIAAIDVQDFEKAAALRDEQQKLEAVIASVVAVAKEGSDGVLTVGTTLIAEVIGSMTGVPVHQMTEAEVERLRNMEDILKEKIVGQDDAVHVVTRSIRRTRAGLKDPKRPSGVFIFAGPSGIGKTETSKALAEYLFGDEEALITIDMSEYAERHTAARLFGAPPGFVGYEDGGQLTERVRRRPFSVILFDEVEKAHPDVFNSFLQLFDEGRLTDGQGRVVDFKNTVIIMTTNLGSRDFANGMNVGFSSDSEGSVYERMKATASREIKQHFRPEFLNRIDETVVFRPLDKKDILQIVDIMVKDLQVRASDGGWTLSVTQEARDFLAEKGYDPSMGARPLRRAIQTYLEDPLSEHLLSLGAATAGVQEPHRFLADMLPDGSGIRVTEDVTMSIEPVETAGVL